MNAIALTIAGSDPSGGAGIQADLRTFESLGVRGLSVITALTAQNSQGVRSVHPVAPDILAAQLEALLDDIQPDAVKIGMLGGAAQVSVVAKILTKFQLNNVVLDPILASTGGVPLLDDAGRDILLTRLLPLCTLVTPNIPEAQQLTGEPLDTPASIEAAGRRLLERGAGAVLIKGGHLDGDPVDTLFYHASIVHFPGKRIETKHTHGTGCFLSSAIAANLARGYDLTTAIALAKDALTQALHTPIILGHGRGYPSFSDGQPLPPDVMPAEIRGQINLLPPRSLDTPLPARNELLERSDITPYASTGRGAGGEGLTGLYVLTDPTLRPDRTPADVTRAALAGGARIIQLREKDRPTPELISLARRLKELTSAAGALFFVNDRIDIAMAAQADGVHLGPDDIHPADAHRLVGPDMLIGVSVSSVEEATPLAPYADYFGVGAIYGSTTKSDAGPPVGVERIRAIKAAFPTIPIVAIGGIALSNIQDVIAAGADSVAVVSAVICADDMEQATRELANKF